ncbi:MAG: cupin domain-containing protein, partial [Marinoscillum sp.]
MIHKLKMLITGMIILSCNQVENSSQKLVEEPLSEPIFPKGQKIESDHFIGEVWLEMFIRDDTTLYATMGNVTFEPGARTNWHSHPGGQILMVTEGLGWYQERGKSKREIRKGEVVTCQPNVDHWHGASAAQSMT